MATAEEPRSDRTSPRRTTDRSPWNWLLVLPVVIPLLIPVFNREEPRLLGFPFFYWAQLAVIIIGVATTTTVYRMTRDR